MDRVRFFVETNVFNYLCIIILWTFRNYSFIKGTPNLSTYKIRSFRSVVTYQILRRREETQRNSKIVTQYFWTNLLTSKWSYTWRTSSVVVTRNIELQIRSTDRVSFMNFYWHFLMCPSVRFNNEISSKED